jgi:hypothetical protein
MNNVIILLVTAAEVLSLQALIVLLAAAAQLVRDPAGLDKLLAEADEMH